MYAITMLQTTNLQQPGGGKCMHPPPPQAPRPLLFSVWLLGRPLVIEVAVRQ